MKNEFLKLSTVVLLLLFIGAGYKNHDIPDDLPPQTLFDTLQGVWSWDYTYNYRIGIIENEFESTVHFLSINSDSTINYETYKNDTLKKNGILKISTTQRGRKFDPDILLHYNSHNENYFRFISMDSMELSQPVSDGLLYYQYFVKNVNNYLIINKISSFYI